MNTAEKKYQIFISSTYEDLKEQRQKVVEAILRLGHLPIGMELFTAASTSSWDVIKDHIDNSDYYIVILAHRYGYIFPDGLGHSFTEKEYDYASKKGIPCIGFIINDKVLWPPNFTEKTKQLKAFKDKLKSKQVNFWEDSHDLAGLVTSSLNNAFNKEPRLGWVRAEPSSMLPSKTDKLFDIAVNAIKKHELISFLKWQYRNVQLLERNGYTYPVAVYPAHKNQRENVESVLGSLDDYEPKHYVVDDSEFLDLTLKLKDGLTLGSDVNSADYTMLNLENNDILKLNCGVGHYFSSYRTCESLEWEIRSNIDKLRGITEDDFKLFARSLPLRNELNDSLGKHGNPVIDGRGRSAAIGISTLIAYKDSSTQDNVYQLVTRRRSKKGVPLRSGLLHVIPGFMFQPMTDIKHEFNVTHNIFREYLEELYGVEEVRDGGDPNYFQNDKRLTFLKSLIKKGEAKIYLTGIGVNLLNLRPEICTLLVISTPEWYDKCTTDPEFRWKFSKEFTSLHQGGAPLREFIGSLPLSTDASMMNLASIYPDRTVPAGAAAFWLGVDVLRDL